MMRGLHPCCVNRNFASQFMLSKRFFSLSLSPKEKENNIYDMGKESKLNGKEEVLSVEEDSSDVSKKNKNWKKKRKTKKKSDIPDETNKEKSSHSIKQFKIVGKQKNKKALQLLSLIDGDHNDVEVLNSEARLKDILGKLKVHHKMKMKDSEGVWTDLESGLSTKLFADVDSISVSTGTNVNSGNSDSNNYSQTLHEGHWLKNIHSPVGSKNIFHVMMLDIDKQWKFPIDNEQDMGVEDETSFEEHVFLDHYLNEFPDNEPIQKYMELVIMGLQKNPYLSVEEKKNKILWHKEYFERFPDEDFTF